MCSSKNQNPGQVPQVVHHPQDHQQEEHQHCSRHQLLDHPCMQERTFAYEHLHIDIDSRIHQN